MPDQIAGKPRSLVELPMTVFLRLADGDGKMTAREMERFDELLAARDWCRSRLLRRSLADTETEKSALWSRYVAGELRTDVSSVAASLDAVLAAIAPEERADLEADLLHFCGELLKAAHGSAGLFRRDGEARAEFEKLRCLIRRPAARLQTELRHASPPEPRSTVLDFSSLLAAQPNTEIFWPRGRLQLRCVQVIAETHDVKTFRFVSEPLKLFRYLPGQFITLELPIAGKTVRRSYTISASPSRPFSISVTAKRVAAGQVSNWLHDNVNVGSDILADGPHGKFTCIGDDGRPYLFISGGSGVTPLMAMSRWLCDTTAGPDIRFLHFARTPDDLIFADELAAMAEQFAGFRHEFICSRTAEASHWPGRTGRISAELLGELVPDFGNRSIYICGPVAFMAATRAILDQLGFPMERFRQESFGGVPREEIVTGSRPARAAKVTFSTSRTEIA